MRKKTERLRLTREEANLIKEVRESGLVTADFQLNSDHNAIKLKKKHLELKKSYKAALDTLQNKDKELEVSNALREVDFDESIFNFHTSESSGDSNSVAVLAISDTHIEEDVQADKINGLNEFNLEIAEKRFKRLFERFIKLVDIQRNGTSINSGVVFLGGDLISGYIHPELVESNTLSPTQAVTLLSRIFKEGFEYLLKEGNFDSLLIVCTSGNHGRTTEKRRINTREDNSYENILYRFLDTLFESEDRIEFQIASGYHVYVRLFDDYTIRFHHGDAFAYGGGVGGMYPSVNKKIAKWNQAIKADLDVFGHFHQMTDGGHWICNGSLIGYNTFALQIGASYEEPQQAFFLIEESKGKTLVAPIFLGE
jgi:hypothetical protein